MIQYYKYFYKFNYMIEKQDYYDQLNSQLEMWEKLNNYDAMVNDYLNSWNPDESKVIKESIIQKALLELNSDQLLQLQDMFVKKALQLSWKQKYKMYELASWVLNWITDKKTHKVDNNVSEGNYRNDSREINYNIPNFMIESGSAKINWKDYVLNLNPNFSSEVKQIWDNEYSMILRFVRDSNSSMRWPEDIEIKFYYDWNRIIFFGDKNRNNNFDSTEYGRAYNVNSWPVQKIIPQIDWTTIIRQDWMNYNINLDKKYLNHYWVDELRFNIRF